MCYWMSGALHITCTNDGGFSFVLQRASRNKGGLQLYLNFFHFYHRVQINIHGPPNQVPSTRTPVLPYQ